MPFLSRIPVYSRPFLFTHKRHTFLWGLCDRPMACSRHRRRTVWQMPGATTDVRQGDFICDQMKRLNDCAAEPAVAAGCLRRRYAPHALLGASEIPGHTLGARRAVPLHRLKSWMHTALLVFRFG